MTYVGINLKQYVQGLDAENLKTTMKEIKEN